MFLLFYFSSNNYDVICQTTLNFTKYNYNYILCKIQSCLTDDYRSFSNIHVFKYEKIGSLALNDIGHFLFFNVANLFCCGTASHGQFRHEPRHHLSHAHCRYWLSSWNSYFDCRLPGALGSYYGAPTTTKKKRYLIYRLYTLYTKGIYCHHAIGQYDVT